MAALTLSSGDAFGSTSAMFFLAAATIAAICSGVSCGVVVAAASGAVPGAGSGAVPGAVPGAGSGAAAASAARLRSAARRLCSRFFWDLLGGVVLARAGSAGSTVTDGASTSDAIARRGAKIQQGLESSLREESCWELYRAQRLAYEAPVV